jgi:hypothetical protein
MVAVASTAGRVKLCTRLRIVRAGEQDGGTTITEADVLDISLVDAEHQFGLDEDGLYHMEGKIISASRRDSQED